jgi:hypothetical protein
MMLNPLVPGAQVGAAGNERAPSHSDKGGASRNQEHIFSTVETYLHIGPIATGQRARRPFSLRGCLCVLIILAGLDLVPLHIEAPPPHPPYPRSNPYYSA